MREELERIWQRPGVAYTCNIAGWLAQVHAVQRNLGTYETKQLTPYKGKRLNPKPVSRKAAIFKHQRLG